jgi:uncharacterized protein
MKSDPRFKARDGSTAFLIALARGHEAVARLMLEHGAEVNTRDRSGGTPLHEAVRQGKIDLVRDLVARGADLQSRTDMPSGPPTYFRSGGLTPFLTAAETGNVAMMRELVALGADPKTKTPEGVGGVLLATGSRKLDAVKLMVELGGDVNDARRSGGTALHTATRQGANDIVQFLVDNGADLSAKDRFGRTPLEAAEFEAPKPTIELLRKLTQNR